MGYTNDNPPLFIRPLLKEYDVEVLECGYNGSWAKIRLEDGTTAHFRREVSNSVSINKSFGPVIRTGISSSNYSNVAERDELVGAVVEEELSGYETLVNAIANL